MLYSINGTITAYFVILYGKGSLIARKEHFTLTREFFSFSPWLLAKNFLVILGKGRMTDGVSFQEYPKFKALYESLSLRPLSSTVIACTL